jgi:hypothetical protein
MKLSDWFLHDYLLRKNLGKIQERLPRRLFENNRCDVSLVENRAGGPQKDHGAIFAGKIRHFDFMASIREIFDRNKVNLDFLAEITEEIPEVIAGEIHPPILCVNAVHDCFP